MLCFQYKNITNTVAALLRALDSSHFGFTATPPYTAAVIVELHERLRDGEPLVWLGK